MFGLITPVEGVTRGVLELSEEEFDEIVTVNLKSAWYGMQSIVPYFQQIGEGHLINVSTFLSKVPFVSFRSIYSASKAALNILATNLCVDLKELYPKIHISLANPGIVSTDFAKNAIGGMPKAPIRSGIMRPQTVDEATEAIIPLIAYPIPEPYTNPALEGLVRDDSNNGVTFEEQRFLPTNP